MQVLILGWLPTHQREREKKREGRRERGGVEWRERRRAAGWGTVKGRLTNGGMRQCLNLACDCACVDEYMYVCRCLNVSTCVSMYKLWEGVSECVSGMHTPLTELTLCVCVCVHVTNQRVSCGCGTEPAVCVGTRHCERSGLLGACEHYCNPNVNWNLDLTEVINKCVCVQSHMDGSTSWWWDSGGLVGEPTTTLWGASNSHA